MARLKRSPVINCRHCQSNDTVAYGRVRGRQRYYCNKCTRTFIKDRKIVVDMKAAKRYAILLFRGEAEGYDTTTSSRDIALIIDVNHTYVARWIKEYKVQEEERKRRRESGRPNRHQY